MRRKHSTPEVFGLSFVDCMASALGSVMILVLVFASAGREQAHRDAEQSVVVNVSVTEPNSGNTPNKPVPCRIGVWLTFDGQAYAARNAGTLFGRHGEVVQRVDVYDNPQQGTTQVWLRQPVVGRWGLRTVVWHPGAEDPNAAAQRPEKVTARLEVQTGRQSLPGFLSKPVTVDSGVPQTLRFRELGGEAWTESVDFYVSAAR